MGVKASAQVTVYYPLQSSKPTKPITYSPLSTWSTTEPSYTAGSTKAYISWIALYFAMIHFSILEFLCLQVTKRQRMHTEELSMRKTELKRIEKGKT